MGKYDPLRRLLDASTESVLRLSFAEIEGILGDVLRTQNLDLNAQTVELISGRSPNQGADNGDFIATLAPGRASNWTICKQEALWGIVGRGNNWRKNAEKVVAGDRIFIWRGGRPNGFIAEIESLECTDFVGAATRVPWPDRAWLAVFPMRVVREVSPPLSDRFPNETGRVGVRYGFNNTALQHIFEKIPHDIAEKVAADLSRPPSANRA